MHIAGLLVALVGFTGAIQAADDLAFRPRFSRGLGRRQFQQRPGDQGAVKPPAAIGFPPQNKGNGLNGGGKGQTGAGKGQNGAGKGQGGGNRGQGGGNKGQGGGNKGQNGGNNQIGAGNGQEQQSLTLSRNSLQRTPNGLQDADAGTDKALQSQNNFINFCSGKPLCNGEQVKTGESCCNPIVMGEIPAPEKMATVVFSQPRLCGNVSPQDGLKISAVYRNINLGTFTNPQNTYNGNPQQLDGNGVVIGHSHVTCHLMENDELQGRAPIAAAAYLQDREQAKSNNNQAPQKTCFKGFNGEGQNAGGGLTRIDLDLECGTNLAEGCWTCSTMTGASTHQAAIMGNADRPAQDASTFFSVSNNPNADLCGCGSRNGGNNNGGNNKGGNNKGGNKNGFTNNGGIKGGINGGGNRGSNGNRGTG